MMQGVYDVVIVGAGPAGLWAALELAGTCNVLLIEAVKRLHDTRNVSNGFMGGSAKSDVRLFVEPGFGGFVKDPKVIDAFLAHLSAHCTAPLKIHTPELSKKLFARFPETNVSVDQPAHIILNSDRLTAAEHSIKAYLEDKIDFQPNCQLLNLNKENNLFEIDLGSQSVFAKRCVLALGRGGAHILKDTAIASHLTASNSAYELGLRLEFPHSALKKYAEKSPGFRLRWDDYRTTAISSKGTVEMDNVLEIKTSNARSIHGKPTYYSSFGLLKTFPDANALQKVTNLVQIVNILADGQLLKESASRFLSEDSITYPIPEFRQLTVGVKKILSVFPELIGKTTVYLPEARINTFRYNLTKNLETPVKNLYLVGDASGLTNSFVQAACTGLLAAKHIKTKL